MKIFDVGQFGSQGSPPGAMREVNRRSKLAAELEYTADVVAVLVGNHNCVHLRRGHTHPFKPTYGFLHGKTTVNHQAGGGIAQLAFK